MPSALDLPPPYTPVILSATDSAHDHAADIAASSGAGTLVWVPRDDTVEFAIVLEPAEDLRRARCGAFACMAALLDALATRAPPEKAIEITWPATILVDGALVGGGRLAWPEDAAEDQTPAWMVFSAMIRISLPAGSEPGATPAATSLVEEGFEPTTPAELIEATARHLMVYFDQWAERGLQPVAEAYLGRLAGRESGDRRGIDINGDLVAEGLLGKIGGRTPLLPALATAPWFDPATRRPRLEALP
jgi:hypothetical protein